MTAIAKIFKTYISPRNLDIFLGKVHCSSKEGARYPEELEPFPKENSLLLGEAVLFTRELFLFHGNLFRIGT
jgi:hypothetical protein